MGLVIPLVGTLVHQTLGGFAYDLHGISSLVSKEESGVKPCGSRVRKGLDSSDPNEIHMYLILKNRFRVLNDSYI